MMKILGLDHLVLRVQDIDAMVGFYERVLGCSVERRTEGLVQLRAGRSLIDLVPLKKTLATVDAGQPSVHRSELDHFCVRVEPFDERLIRQHLAACGVEAGETVSRYGAEGEGPSIYFADCEGNFVELKGPPVE
ncbi:VOC family protein [Roseateles sp. NT4]|uniref:VOC family protein n=1 Tax=Roseateles sp. NT4 TaxID=3453715 RepID=UPI003EEAC633